MELLVVITIIGILIALLLPAVQAAREAARRVQCTNNLKQMALGCLLHERAQGYLPSGGWRYLWMGDPDRGFDRRQPGGWLYNVLPYIEQEPLHNMGAGMPLANKKAALVALDETPITVVNCPTRRAAIVYPSGAGQDPYNTSGGVPFTPRSDYAGNGGAANPDQTNPNGWWSYPVGNANGGDPSFADAAGFNQWPTPAMYSTYDGVICCAMVVKFADITDGASNTYLIGEKYLNPDSYYNGQEADDNNGVFVGFDWDFQRWTGMAADIGTGSQQPPPQQDTPGLPIMYTFGSAHATGFNMAFCDGSVQAMNYSLDLLVHSRLGSRNDGVAIDGKKY